MLRRPSYLLAVLLALAGCGGGEVEELDLGAVAWAEIEQRAEGQTVNMIMWLGDPYVNAYMQEFVTPAVRERYGVDLQISSGQGSEVVAVLMAEKEAGAARSEFDLVWINGETFYQLRQIDALYGPFLDRLPNAELLDLDNPFINTDFQQPIDGYEAPWGNVQLALIYDSLRTPSPPKNREELAAWVRANPGRFTIDTAFTGMTFLKGLLIDLAGGPGSLSGDFDEALYERHAPELWAYLNGIKRYFWNGGRTFPSGTAQLHQMFAAGEVDFTMSNNDGEVDNKVIQGLFPETARAYVLESGTIQNTHYLGVVAGAPHKAGALVTINFLISPEAQWEKLKPDVWGDGTVLDVEALPVEWQGRFRDVPGRAHAPPRAEIQGRALQEPAPEYMVRLYEDFRTHVIRGGRTSE